MEKIYDWLTNNYTHNEQTSRVIVASILVLLCALVWWWALSMQSSTVVEVGPEEDQLLIQEI